MRTNHGKQAQQGKNSLILSACFLLLFPSLLQGQLFQVDQVSDPAGYLTESEAIQQGTNHPSVSPTLSATGYAFGYWTVNDLRQSGADGRSLTQISSVINGSTTYKAYYFAESADSDGDGIKDWFEYRMWGDLSQAGGGDPDGDGFSNLRENELGQDPLIIDMVEDGGISGRLSTGFVYADTSMVLATMRSDPAGFVTESSNYLEMNSSVSTSNLHGETNGYQFAYWSLNGLRQAAPSGASVSKVDLNFSSTTTLIAHYLPSGQDSDGDGVKDWFELYQFGDLSQGPTDDPDGDGFSNQRESELGQEATIVDAVEDGGISGRLSTGFVYADTSMVLATVKSDPAGFVTETNTYLEMNGSLATASLNGASTGYNFAYWSVNGVRQAGPTGVSISKIDMNVTQVTTVIAHYLPSGQDSDGDGVKDWFELYQFGDLSHGPADDPDGDGFSNQRESELGQEANIMDAIEDGGISGRLSTGLLYYQQQNRPPSNLELNNTIVFLNKEANRTVGTFSPTDPDDPNVMRTYGLGLITGSGSTNNGLFNLSGMDLRTAQTLTVEGNFSILVRVTDDENASFDKNFTLIAIDPLRDDDGDGLGYEQELLLGTGITVFDSDGDGAGDGSEFTAGTDPLDSSVFPNRPPVDLNATTVLTIAENQPIGTVVGEFNATELDGDPLTFELPQGQNYSTNANFTIDSNGTLRSAVEFNYETNASDYSITVKAKDDQNASTEKIFSVSLIDANDKPVFLSIGGVVSSISHNQEISVMEGFSNYLEINATDEDGDAITFEKTSGADITHFDLNATNGRLTINFIPDFEIPQDADLNNSYQIGFRAVDGRGGTQHKQLCIRVVNVVEDFDGDGTEDHYDSDDDNDGFSDSEEVAYGSNPKDANSTANVPPHDILPVHFVVNENEPAGTLVDILNGLDADAEDQLHYSLLFTELNGVKDFNNQFFNLDANGSLVTVKSFDHETTPLFRLKLRVTDEHNKSFERSRNLTIKDLNEPPFDLNVTTALTLRENLPVGTKAGLLSASDPDTNDSLVYSLSTGAVDNAMFYVDGNGTVRSNAEFDFETQSEFVIRAVVRDEDNFSIAHEFSVFISNEIEDLDGDGLEDHYDPDDDGDGYSDAEETGYGSDPRDPNSVANAVPVITLADLYPGQIDQYGTLHLSNFENQSHIVQVTSSDADADDLNYSIYGWQDLHHFEINSSTGDLRFKNPPDFEFPTDHDGDGIYAVLVRVSDGKAHADQSLFVRLTDQNEYPVDLNTGTTLTLSENQPVNTFIGEFFASDPDANANLEFDLVDGNGSQGNAYFSVDGNRTLRSAQMFDFESNQSVFSIRVGVSDEHNFSISQTFQISLLNVIEDFDGDGIENHYDTDDDGDGYPDADELAYPSDPLDPNSVANASPDSLELNGSIIKENKVPGSRVGQLSASDPDQNSSLTFFLLENSAPEFELDERGMIRTKRIFDFETDDLNYTIFTRVSDEHNFSLDQSFIISLLNEVEDPDGDGIENHYDPDDDGDGYPDVAEIEYGSDPLDPNSISNGPPVGLLLSANSVFENALPGTFVGEFNASDPNPGTVLRYSLIDGNGSTHHHLFELEQTGMLRTSKAIDFEMDGAGLSVRVQVTDERNASLEKVFEIFVTDEFRPIVRTVQSAQVFGTSVRLAGEVVDIGGKSELLEKGIIVSVHPDPVIYDSQVIKIMAKDSAVGMFELQIDDLNRGETYFYRAYAKNIEGINYGTVERFQTEKIEKYDPLWADAFPSPGVEGWWESSWFGSFFLGDDKGWIMHENFGWLFILPKENGFWIWQEALGWIWTSSQSFPYLYQSDGGSWLFYHGSNATNSLYYSFGAREWIQLSKQ